MYRIAILVSSGDDAGSGCVLLSLVLFHPPPEPERPRGGTRAGAFKGSRPPFGAPPPDGRRGEKAPRRGSGERDSPISALEPSPAMSIAFDGRESGLNFSPNHCQFGKSPLFPALVEREEGDSLEQEDRRENEGFLLLLASPPKEKRRTCVIYDKKNILPSVRRQYVLLSSSFSFVCSFLGIMGVTKGWRFLIR